MIIHTVPVNDIEPHFDSTTCACKPVCEMAYNNILVIHNSFDGREALETLFLKGELNILITKGWEVL